jgi:hypothetical protein
MTQPDEHVQAEKPRHPDKQETLRQELTTEISRLRSYSLRGVWSLSLFLLVSLYAWRSFPLFPPPETFISYLGTPPSAYLVSSLFVVYTFFAILLSLSRMIAGVAHHGSLSHVAYLSGFFFFYYVAKALDDNYWAVFAAGITILAVESYRIWAFCQEALARSTERLAFVEKNGYLPPDE